MSVMITKEGITCTEWDGTIREYVPKEIKHPYHELRNACSIEKGVTLKDIINIVGKDKKLSELVGEYSWCNVAAFVKEVNKPSSKKSDLSAIELGKYAELHKAHGSEKYGDLDIHIHVSGIDDKDPETGWAIEFTPVNEMADVEVRLNPELPFHDWRQEVTTNLETMRGTACFTLLEVLTEIFYEISFCGSPKERDEASLNLKQTVDEVKEAIESGDDSKFVPFELPKETIQ